MRNLIIIPLFISSLFGLDSPPRQAKKKFAVEDYGGAAQLFETAIGDYPRQRGALEFNIAMCWHRVDSTDRALSWYSRASENKLDLEIGSMAWNNLGVLWANKPDAPSAPPTAGPVAPAPGADPIQAELDKVNRSLEAFKTALRKFPDNDFARYNYELLKRKQQQLQQQQQQQQQNQDEQQEQDQQQEQKDQNQQNRPQDQQKSKRNTENKGNQGEEGEAEQIPMEQARQLLEAMKDNEKRFLQQLEKSKKRRPTRQDGPDW